MKFTKLNTTSLLTTIEGIDGDGNDVWINKRSLWKVASIKGLAKSLGIAGEVKWCHRILSESQNIWIRGGVINAE